MKQGHMIVGRYMGGGPKQSDWTDPQSNRTSTRKLMEHLILCSDGDGQMPTPYIVHEKLPDNTDITTYKYPHNFKEKLVLCRIKSVFTGKTGKTTYTIDSIEEVTN